MTNKQVCQVQLCQVQLCKVQQTNTFLSFLATPVGELLIEANNDGLTKVLFVETTEDVPTDTTENHITQLAKQQLSEYIAGTRQVFDLPLALKGTAFQQHVWQQLLGIAYGKTASYLEIARALGKPKACRAVGAANGKNPISIIVPCHRIIGANGSLTGYAGGLSRKQFLLALEQAH